jgi:gliding motility-associated-like protein
MKKICTLLLFTVSLVGFAQGGITVYPTSGYVPTAPLGSKEYSVNDLVNKVLMNAPCAATLSVTQKNGNMFGSSNSIGYFENMDIDNPNQLGNPIFPYLKGVVLTSGNVLSTPGPKGASALSEGGLPLGTNGLPAWTGDLDLNATMASAGITSLNSTNASLLEFDFAAIVNQLNFDFLFASEEYGLGQCNFSDSFAFLVKDLSISGDTYHNIAVIPSTNIPISVGTIRDQLYNNGCPSVNPSFFGTINNTGYGPAINFNGQTTSMTATYSLILGHNYHLKIVVADSKNNSEYDSAIFLKAGSLNIASVIPLPPDMIGVNAFCPGATLPIVPATGLAAGTLYRWELNGSVIFNTALTPTSVNLNDPMYTANISSGNINHLVLKFTEPGCVLRTDDYAFEIRSKINSLAVVPNIYVCSTGAANYSFDLTKNTVIIKNNNTPLNPLDDLPASTDIKFYLTSAAANVGTASTELVSPYTGTDNQTIWARVTNQTTGCYEVRSFQLKVIPIPVVVAIPSPVTQCARNLTDATPQSMFTFTAQMATILGGPTPTYYKVSYYISAITANNGGNTGLLTGGNSATTSTRTVYVRIENISDSSCYVVTSFDIIVTPLPPVDTIANVTTCSSYTLPALLTLPTATTTGAGYYTATNGGLPQIPAGTVYNTPGSTTIYIFNTTTGTPACKSEKTLKITIADLTTITPVTATFCENDNYVLPSLPYGEYYEYSGGPNNSLNLSPIPVGSPITSTKTIYVGFSDPLAVPAACFIEQAFTININPFTNLDPANYPNLFFCNPGYVVPLSTIPAGVLYYKDAAHTQLFTAADNPINVTTTIYVQKKSTSTPVCTSDLSFTIFIGIGNIVVPTDVTECTSYALPVLTVGEYRSAANGGGNPISAGTIITTTTIIYYHIPGQDCTDNIFFTVTIITTPLPTFNDLAACDHYELPDVSTQHAGGYFTLANGAGTPRAAGYSFTSTKTFYFYYNSGMSTSAGVACKFDVPFTVTINHTPDLPARAQHVTRCNSSATPCLVLDALPNGNYYALSGGPSTASNPPLPAGTQICAPGANTIYVYDSNGLSGSNTCFREYPIDVYIVNGLVTPIEDVYACNSYTLPAISGVGDYYTLSGGPNTVGNVKINLSTYPPVTTTKTFWVYYNSQDPRYVDCSSEDQFTVNILQTPVITAISAVTWCDSYTLPAYSSYPSTVPVTHYYPNPGGPTAAGNATGEKLPGNLITATTTLYAYASVQGTVLATGITTVCSDEKPFVININYTPVIQPITPIGACDSYALPAYSTISSTVPVTHFYTTVTGPFTDSAATISAPGATVYAYAETNTAPNCIAVRPFVITVHNTPTIAAVAPMITCDSYILPAFTDTMFLTTGGTVTHYYPNPGGPTVAGNTAGEKFPGDVITATTTLYPYLSVGTNALGDTVCFDDTPWVITINHTPVFVPSEIAAVVKCDSHTLPALTVGNYYTDATHSALLPNLTITNTDTVYIYAETGTTPNCAISNSFSVTINHTPVIAAIAPETRCSSYALPNYAAPVTAYYTLPGGPLTASNLTKVPGDLITTTTTLYAYADTGTTPNCPAELAFNVIIDYPPVVAPIAPVFACDSYILPALIAPATKYYTTNNPLTRVELFVGSVINSSTTIYAYAESGTIPCTTYEPMVITITYTPVIAPVDYANVNVCNSYTLPALTTVGANYYSGPNGSGSIITAGTVYTTNQLIHVYAVNGTGSNTCPSIDQTLSIVIYNVDDPYPLSIYPNGVPSCGPYLLPALTTLGAQYYNGPNGSGGIIPANTGGQIYVYNTQPVYIFGTSPSGCTDEVVFNVTVNVNPIANPVQVALTTVCDLDGIDDHITSFDVTTLTSTVLGTQSPAIYTIAYYPTPLDAAANTNAIATTTTLGTIYVKVSNTATPSCNVIMPITISVVPLPIIPGGKLSGTICIDSTTGQITPPVISSGYSAALYSFLWTDSSPTPVGVGTAPDFLPTIPGNYTLVITASGVSGCASAPIPVTVIQSAKPVSVSFTTSGWFTNNQTIIVDAVPYPGTGNGSNFVYSLDGQTPQTSNIFTNVDSGAHEVSVIDINNCGDLPLPVPVPLVNSPAYFSPNGDGINDVWRIQGLQNQLSSQVFIYDRYGKMLKQLSGNSDGWDGTFNGLALPADDYWFTVTYIENGDPKEFKSHFTLRR